jgi:hypothetical protein
VALVDDILAALPSFRVAANSLMLDECLITRPGIPVTDPDSGDVTNTPVTVYTGKCKVQSKDSATSSPEAGEHTFTVVSRQVHIPANAADVQDGDVVTITASRLTVSRSPTKHQRRGPHGLAKPNSRRGRSCL